MNREPQYVARRLCVAVLALLTACTSTTTAPTSAPPASERPPSGAAPPGVAPLGQAIEDAAAPPPVSPRPAAVALRVAEAAAAAQGATPPSSVTSAPRHPTAAGAPPRGSGGAPGPGVGTSTIALGVAWAPDTQSRFQAVTGSNTQFADWSKLAPAVFEIMNRRGGIAGHRIVLEPWYEPRGNGRYQEWQAQQCSHFTERERVFAVLSPAPPGEVLQRCWHAHQMPSLDGLFHFSDDDVHRRYPGSFTLGSPSLTRFAGIYVQELVRQRFFSRGSRIGLVTYDTPRYRRVVEGPLGDALRRHGLSLDRVAWLPQPDSTGQAAEILGVHAPAAVREFRDRGIDRVLFLETNPFASGAFMIHVERQQYRGFRYGISSFQRPSTPGSTGDNGYAIPTAQLARSQGLGWAAVSDLRDGAEPLLNPDARWWVAELRRRGLLPEGCSLCAVDALTLVEMVTFLDRALEAGRGPVNLARLRAGAEALGSAAPALTGYRSAFGPQRHDGTAAYRELRWAASCRCFRHVGPLRSTG